MSGTGRPLGAESAKGLFATVNGHRWVDVDKAAQMLKLNPTTVRRLAKEHSLAKRRGFRGNTMVREVDFPLLRPVVEVPRAIAMKVREAMVDVLGLLATASADSPSYDTTDLRHRLDQLEVCIDPRLEDDDDVPHPNRRGTNADRGLPTEGHLHTGDSGPEEMTLNLAPLS